MVAPYRYNIQAPSAFESLVSGLKLGDSIVQMQAQDEQNRLRAEQMRQQMEAEAQRKALLEEYRSIPVNELSRAKLSRFAGVFQPEVHKALNEYATTVDQNQLSTGIGQKLQMMALAMSNDKDRTSAYFDDLIAAAPDDARRKALMADKTAALNAPQEFAKQNLLQLDRLGEIGQKAADRFVEMYGMKPAAENWKPLSPTELKNMGWKEDTQAIRDSVTGNIKAVGSAGTSVSIKNEGSIPPGYQAVRDPAGNISEMRPIPGSPAAADAQARQSATEARAAGRVQAASVVTQEIDRLDEALAKEEQAGGLSAASPYVRITGVPGKAFEGFPGGARTAAQGFIDTIKANIGFEQLSKMRQESQTGAALGNITEQELKFLQATLGAIDLNSDPKVLRQNIKRLREVYNLVVHGQASAPAGAPSGAPPAAPAGTAQPATPAATQAPARQRPPLEDFFRR